MPIAQSRFKRPVAADFKLYQYRPHFPQGWKNER